MTARAQSRLLRRFSEPGTPLPAPAKWESNRDRTRRERREEAAQRAEELARDPSIAFVEQAPTEYDNWRRRVKWEHQKITEEIRLSVGNGFRYDYEGNKKWHWPRWQRAAFSALHRIKKCKHFVGGKVSQVARRHTAYLCRDLREQLRRADSERVREGLRPAFFSFAAVGWGTVTPGLYQHCYGNVLHRLHLYPLDERLKLYTGRRQRSGMTRKQWRASVLAELKTVTRVTDVALGRR